MLDAYNQQPTDLIKLLVKRLRVVDWDRIIVGHRAVIDAKVESEILLSERHPRVVRLRGGDLGEKRRWSRHGSPVDETKYKANIIIIIYIS